MSPRGLVRRHRQVWAAAGDEHAPTQRLSLHLVAIKQRQNGGRPHRLNERVGVKPDGTPITTRTAILEWLRQPLPNGTAIAHAGVHTSTMNNWIREAARAARRLEINPKARLTPHERDLIVFARQVEAARAEGEAKLWGVVNKLAEGGLRRTKISVKTERRVVNGQTQDVEVERKTIVEETLPSLNAARYLLEAVYGNTRTLEERDIAMSDDDAAQHLGDAMERWLSTREADVQPPALDHSTNGHANGSASPSD